MTFDWQIKKVDVWRRVRQREQPLWMDAFMEHPLMPLIFSVLIIALLG